MKILSSCIAAAAILLSTQAAFAQEPPWDCQYKPQSRAKQAMEGSRNVTVQYFPNVGEADYIRFEPSEQISVNKAFIIQPGGNVEPEAYAIQALAFAEEGYRVYIMGYDTCLPIAEISKADVVFDTDTEIQEWPVAMGGHSLGGVVTVMYINGGGLVPPRFSDSITGLAMWAAYPSDDDNLYDRVDLSDSSASIWATDDGLTSPDDISRTALQLPQDTSFVSISGGNHSQYGDYGFQDGDNPATITPEVQMTTIIDNTLEHVLNPMTNTKKKKHKKKKNRQSKK